MTTAELQVKEWGNSLGIIIPREIVKNQGIKKGTSVKVNFLPSGKIDGFGILKDKNCPRFVRDRTDDWRY